MEYALAAAIGLGVIFVFGGVYALMTSGGSIDERLARYAGGKPAEDEKKKTKERRPDVDMAVLTSDVEDKRLSMKVQRDLARANLKLKVSEYYYLRFGMSAGLG